MANRTTAEILARWRVVLEADDVGLLPTREPFSHDRQPSTVLDGAYYLDYGGITSERSQSNETIARVERVTVYVTRALKFDGQTEVEALHDTLDTIERALKADGPDQSYHVWTETRRMTRPTGTNHAVGSVSLLVDYDFSEAVA